MAQQMNASLSESIRSLRDPPSSSPAPDDEATSQEYSVNPKREAVDSSGAISPLRSQTNGQRFNRPTVPGTEDMTRSPKERFDNFLASTSQPPLQEQESAPSRTPSKASVESSVPSTATAKKSHPPSHAANPSQTSQTSQASRETTDEDVDPATLIISAGSPEAAIQSLIKEKRTTAARMDQLWKLIEKQRSMVLGLNKDLERALKEKERYKKKLKETEHALAMSPDPLVERSPGRELPLREANGPISPDDLQYADSSTANKSGVSSPGERTRKAPPTPLNLAKSNKSQTELVEPRTEEYDVAEFSPEYERGRRRTREEDDQEREEAAIEEERRSQSNKKSKSKSKSKQPVAIQPPEEVEQPAAEETPVGVGLPTSPRAPLLGGLQSPMQAPVGAFNRGLPPPNSRPQNGMGGMGGLKSPGLPMSPRPGDRPLNAPIPRPPTDSLPLSPRVGTAGLPLSPRAPRQPIPQPASSWAPPPRPKNEQASEDSSEGPIYRGLVSEQYPNLLLPPNALPLVEVQVDSSRLRPPRNGEEEPVFVLAISSRSDRTQLWRVEKTILALPPLDQSLRLSCDFNARLPDKGLFQGHSPAKIDARRAALNAYFETMLDTPMNTNAAVCVCTFLSTDVIGPRSERSSIGSLDASSNTSRASARPKKEGYLAKKGKQFGGWKARYFVLESSELRHYEAPGGAHLGSIKLVSAQIAKQTAQDLSEDAEYRHGFMILEPKRKDCSSLVRHVLCAESDGERDEWVEALMVHIEAAEDGGIVRTGSVVSRQPTLQSLNYDDAVASDAPVVGDVPLSPGGRSASGSAGNSPTVASYPTISSPVAGGPIQNASAWGNKAAPGSHQPRERDYRKMFTLKGRGSEDSSPPVHEKPKMSRPVFGMALAEAAEVCQPYGINVALPAVVYRCIEYLQAKGASAEEGIFRLSGSNVEIKTLKERFNTEGDVKLLDGQYHDVHAVASLLKLYLRELPESVLTRDLHLEFLKVIDVGDKSQKAQVANSLVHRLPEANFELLVMLSRFLVDIVHSSGTSKMNARNVGIIFSPTLNIPAPLISLFISDYSYIFGQPFDGSSDQGADSPLTPQSNMSDDIRSPRKQMFSDLATPAYNQTTFSEPQGFAPPQKRPAPTMTQVSETGFGSLNAALAPAPRAAPPSGGVVVDTSKIVRGNDGLFSPGIPLSPAAGHKGFGRI